MDKTKIELALFRLAGGDQLLAIEFRAQSLLGIEAKVRLALTLVRTVAFKAIVTEQRTNLPIKVNLLRPAPAGKRKENENQKNLLHGFVLVSVEMLMIIRRVF